MARRNQDIDINEFGYPRAPPEVESPLTEDQLGEQERKRNEVLQRHTQMERHITVPEPPVKLTDALQNHLTSEDYDNFGYPKVPEEWGDEYFRNLLDEEMADPRVNPNLLLDDSQQEFWNNVARKPYAKAILRSEQHWTNRRNVWLRQYEKVAHMNNNREEIAEQLEDCSMEVKRLVAPILHQKICETCLWTWCQEAKGLGVALSDMVEMPEKLRLLHSMRKRIDLGGDRAAAEMMDEYDMRARRLIFDKSRAKEMEKKDRIEMDSDTLVKTLNWGMKCKKDGLLEWEKGNWEEALSSWRQADDKLKLFKAPANDKNGNKIIADLHISVLKNLAQAAIKCEYWTEALDAANDALRIDNQDHKAWFRKLCALEGLGRFAEANEALRKIDEIAVERVDRDRITKDIQAKREKLQAIVDRSNAAQKTAINRALAHGIFSGDRDPITQTALPEDDCDGTVDTAPLALTSLQDEDEGHEEVGAEEEGEEPSTPQEPAGNKVTETARKRITKDGCADLLEELRIVYSDTGFQMQVRKMSIDVRRDRTEFMNNLRKVAIEVQRPLLRKWGFDNSSTGVRELQRAIQDHTLGPSADSVLKAKAEMLTKLLYGDMYAIIYPGLLPAASTGAAGREDGHTEELEELS